MDVGVLAFCLFLAGTVVGVILKDWPSALIAAGLAVLNLP